MKKLWKYFNPRELLFEIQFYGYHYSLKKHLFVLGGVITGSIGLASILGLNRLQICCVVIVMLAFMPMLISHIFKELYEQKKFMDVCNYLEQMLYSFRRKSKIINALEETAILFPDGVMGKMIDKTLEQVSVLETEGDLYRTAFEIMESEYKCEIMKRIHNFMIRVEMRGGEHQESSDILIRERNHWVARVLETQKEKQLIKRNVMIGIVLSLIVVVGTIWMVPDELVNIQTNIGSQISGMFALLINFLLWTFVQCKFSGSWIQEEKTVTDIQFEKYYSKVVSPISDRKDGYKIVSLGLALASMSVCYLTKQIWLMLIVFMVVGIICTNRQRVYRIYKKRLKKEVEKSFPDWMMTLSLLLQTENVQGAIVQSYEYAPVALQHELEIMIDKMEQNPTSIEPYLDFYDFLNIPDMQSAMRMLYSMSQSGGHEMSKQINALVERNSQLQDQSMRLKTEDYLAGMSFCVLIPMVIGSGKMLVDMGVLLFSLMNKTQGIF